MTDTPFAPPAESAQAAPPPRVATPLRGGRLPEIGKLFSDTMEEFAANIGPYALAGLGVMVASIPIVLLLVALMYGGMFGFVLVMIGGSAGAAATLPEDAAILVTVVVQLVSMIGMVVMIFAMIAAISLLMAPLNASLLRAVRDQQRGGPTLTFGSPFSTLTQDLGKVLGAGIIVAALLVVGLSMCYLPALLVAFFTAFAASLVALHRMGGVAAVRASAAHTLAAPGWHGLYFLMLFGVNLAASYVPVIGPMFVYALMVRAHREVFGDGEEPVLEVTA